MVSDFAKKLLLLNIICLMVLLPLIELRRTQSQVQPQVSVVEVLGVETQKESRGMPVRLKIPSINVDANIQYLGVASNGEMEVPSNSDNVGWYKLGPSPGEKGSAVIAGHLNGENGEKGVFTYLNMLKNGDKVYIENDLGVSTTFIVRESRTYDRGYADEVFTRGDEAYLNLVTCDGTWNTTQKSYTKRLVVFTDVGR